MKKQSVTSAEFQTSDGLKSVLHKRWPLPPPPICRRAVYPYSAMCGFVEVDVPAYPSSYREYELYNIEYKGRTVKKVIYRERLK